MARPEPSTLALSEQASDLVSAALRHLRDAEHLADRSSPHASPDQAYHLAGFAPECMRKATLGVRWFDMAIGHRFDDAAEGVLAFAIALDPMSLRYNPREVGVRFPELNTWREDVRYRRTGYIPAARVDCCVVEARAVADEMLFALWADGRLDGASLSW